MRYEKAENPRDETDLIRSACARDRLGRQSPVPSDCDGNPQQPSMGSSPETRENARLGREADLCNAGVWAHTMVESGDDKGGLRPRLTRLRICRFAGVKLRPRLYVAKKAMPVGQINHWRRPLSSAFPETHASRQPGGSRRFRRRKSRRRLNRNHPAHNPRRPGRSPDPGRRLAAYLAHIDRRRPYLAAHLAGRPARQG